MGSIPYLVLACYLVLLLALGLVSLIRSRQTEEDFYLAGRGQGILTTALTIMATYFSGFALLTFPGWVYQYGLAPMLLALNLPVAGAAVYILGNRIRRLGRERGYMTPGDLLSGHYGNSAAVRLVVAFISFLYVLPYVIMQIKAGGHLAQGMFGELEAVQVFGFEFTIYNAGATALSLVTMLYVLVGGMRSVAWTDVVQGGLLLGGMLLAGVAVFIALGGVGPFFSRVSRLPAELLAVSDASGRWNPWWIMTYCMFASLASVVQPAQWMRFYSAKSSDTLRKTAVIFSIVLPCCFLFGVLLVGIGGRVLYPAANTEAGFILPERLASADQIVLLVMQDHLPDLLGGAGVVLVSVIFVAIMAASMSTADSNLHALSAVVTRDVYDRFVRPHATERERAWVARLAIVAATLAALGISYVSEVDPDFGLMRTIGHFFLLAMALSCQLLPVTLDVLFIRRGTAAGAVAGMGAGLFTIFLLSPFLPMLTGPGTLAEFQAFADDLKRLLDLGFLGFVVNITVLYAVSRFTRKPAAQSEPAPVDAA